MPAGTVQLQPAGVGTTRVRLRASDSDPGSTVCGNFDVTVKAVNTPPQTGAIFNPVDPEANAATTGNTITHTIFTPDPGNPSEPTWTVASITCTPAGGTNAGLFAQTPTFTTAGVASYRINAQVSGFSDFTCTMTDNGPCTAATTTGITPQDTANHVCSSNFNFRITVGPDNDQPTISLGCAGCCAPGSAQALGAWDTGSCTGTACAGPTCTSNSCPDPALAGSAAVCTAVPDVYEDNGVIDASTGIAVTLPGFMVAHPNDVTEGAQTIVSETITCTPTSYDGGTHSIFTDGPRLTGCTNTADGNSQFRRCDLTYTVAPDEFTEGLNPGFVTCEIVVQDSGGTGICGQPPWNPVATATNCDTQRTTFTISVKPVNDRPILDLDVPPVITLKEDCGCWDPGAAAQGPFSTTPTPANPSSGCSTPAYRAQVFSPQTLPDGTVCPQGPCPGPYNELRWDAGAGSSATGQQIRLSPTAQITIAPSDNAFARAAGVNDKGESTGCCIHITDSGELTFTPAPHRNGDGTIGNINQEFTVTVTVRDDGMVPCLSDCACAGGSRCPFGSGHTDATYNPELDSNSVTFKIRLEEVNDPPYVELATTQIHVPEDCGPQDITDFIRQVTAGQGPYGAHPTNYPTPEERGQTVTLQPQGGALLEIIPPEASIMFMAGPQIVRGGVPATVPHTYTSNQQNQESLTFTCATGRSTTHPYVPACGLRPPGYNPTGVLAPPVGSPAGGPLPAGPGATAPRAPTGAVTIRLTFQDDGGTNGGCGQDTTVKEFQIVINEVNNKPKYTTRPMPSLELYEDSYGEWPGTGLDCKSPLDVDARECRRENPRELKINDWLDNFTTGSPEEDYFERLTWLLKPEHGEYFYSPWPCHTDDEDNPNTNSKECDFGGPKIDQYQCPLVDDHKALRMTLEPHSVGTTTVSLDCWDSGIQPKMCGETFFRIEIKPVNDPPDACPRMNSYTHPQCTDAGGCKLELNWLRDISPGGGMDERQQQVQASCTWGPMGGTAEERKKELFEGTAQLDTHSGVLDVTLRQFAQGTGYVDCVLEDDGSTQSTPCDMNSWSFRLNFNILPVNECPVWETGTTTGGADLFLQEDEIEKTIYGFATKVSASEDPQEKEVENNGNGQGLRFGKPGLTYATATTGECGADDPSLFSTQPTLSLSGDFHTGKTEADLKIAPAPDAFGTTTVRCVLYDSGSCGTVAGPGGNIDECCMTERIFRVTVQPVNDRPSLSFTKNPIEVPSGTSYREKGIVLFNPGPPNEDGQNPTYTVQVPDEAAALFVQPPEVMADGTLQFVAADGASGNVTVEITVTDDGGGPEATSLPQYLTILVLPLNTAPSFTLSTHDVTMFSAGGVQYAPGLATGMTKGIGTHEGTQTIAFEVCCYDATLFAEPPTIDENGQLRARPVGGKTGVTTAQVRLRDNGPCGGLHECLSPPQEIVIEVTPAATLKFLAGPDVTVGEDAPPHGPSDWAHGVVATPGANLTWTTADWDREAFASAPTVDADGKLRFAVKPDVVGRGGFHVCLSDGSAQFCRGGMVNIVPVNDPPTFELSEKVVAIAEGATTVAVEHLIHAISPGPPDEWDQTVTLAAIPAAGCTMFSAQPEVEWGSLTGGKGTAGLKLSMSPTASGSCSITVVATDSLGLNASQTFLAAVVSRNDPPSFNPGGVVVTRAGSPPYSDVWATQISAGGVGEDTVQKTSFELTYDKDAAAKLFLEGPALLPNGTVSFTPRDSVEGTLQLWATLVDDGIPPARSATSSFSIVVVGHDGYVQPSFAVPSTTVRVQEDSGSAVFPRWCTLANLSAGHQPSVTVAVQTQGSGSRTLFARTPAVSLPDCALALQPAPDAAGDAVLSFTFRDGRSVIERTARVEIAAVNDAPSFSVDPLLRLIHVAVPEAGDGVRVQKTLFARDITAGAPDEDDAQALRFTVTGAEPGFFSQQPVLSADGTLTFVLPAGALGSTQLRATLHDDGAGAPPPLSSTPAVFFIAAGRLRNAAVLSLGSAPDPIKLRESVAALLSVPIARVSVADVFEASADAGTSEWSRLSPADKERRVAANTVPKPRAVDSAEWAALSPAAKSALADKYAGELPSGAYRAVVTFTEPGGAGVTGAPSGEELRSQFLALPASVVQASTAATVSRDVTAAAPSTNPSGPTTGGTLPPTTLAPKPSSSQSGGLGDVPLPAVIVMAVAATAVFAAIGVVLYKSAFRPGGKTQAPPPSPHRDTAPLRPSFQDRGDSYPPQMEASQLEPVNPLVQFNHNHA